jgi:hypothetical protein
MIVLAVVGMVGFVAAVLLPRTGPPSSTASSATQDDGGTPGHPVP